jgi:hypothetical protein
MSDVCKEHPHGRCIHIDLLGRTLRAFEDGKLKITVHPIIGGRPGFLTRCGKFSIDPDRRFEKHTSSEFPPPHGGAPMPFSLFFNGGQAIHGGDPNAPSHGCVHVAVPEAERVFKWVADHAVRVVVTGCQPAHSPRDHQHHAHPHRPHQSNQLNLPLHRRRR